MIRTRYESVLVGIYLRPLPLSCHIPMHGCLVYIYVYILARTYTRNYYNTYVYVVLLLQEETGKRLLFQAGFLTIENGYVFYTIFFSIMSAEFLTRWYILLLLCLPCTSRVALSLLLVFLFERSEFLIAKSKKKNCACVRVFD